VARRLVERGVRFIELIDVGSSRNWDAHSDMKSHETLAKNGPCPRFPRHDPSSLGL
jgi:hypothetical protein